MKLLQRSVVYMREKLMTNLVIDKRNSGASPKVSEFQIYMLTSFRVLGQTGSRLPKGKSRAGFAPDLCLLRSGGFSPDG